MSDSPGGAANLGSAFSEIGFRNDRGGFTQFIRDASDVQQAIAKLQQTIAGQQPLSIPIAGLERAVAQQLSQIQQTISRSHPFEPLTREAAETVAQVEEQFRKLAAKRDELQSTIQQTGLSASERRKFFDSQGRARSNTDDDQKYDNAFENAKRATSLSNAEGDVNSVRAEIEKAQAAAEKLRGVMAEIRTLQQTEGAGSKRNEIAVSYLEAAQAVEQYAEELQQAITQQTQASQRAEQLERRVANLGAASTDPARSDEKRGQASYLAAAASNELAEAKEREARASAQATNAEDLHAQALKELTAAQTGYQRSLRASQARQAAQPAPAPATSTTEPLSQPEEAARRVAAAYEILDTAVSKYIVQAREASESDQRQTVSLNTLTEALRRVTDAEESFIRAQGQRATNPAPIVAPTVVTAQTQQRTQTSAAATAAITRAEIAANATVEAATKAGDSRVEAERIAGVARVEAAEKAASSRTTTAELTGDARVEAERIRAANRIELLERRQAPQNRGPALPRTFAGFTGGGLAQAAGALGVVSSLDEAVGKFGQYAAEGQRVQVALDQTRASLGALMGDQTRANGIFDRAITTGQELGFTQLDTAEAIRTSALIIRESQAPIEEIFNVLARLQVLSPEQGLEGAALAVKELAAGDIVSLRERFEVSASSANKLKAEIKAGGDAVLVLGRYLDQIGIGDGALEAQLQGAAGQQRAYNQAVEALGVAINDVVTSSGWKEFLTGLVGGTADEVRLIQNLIDKIDELGQAGQESGPVEALSALEDVLSGGLQRGLAEFVRQFQVLTGTEQDVGDEIQKTTNFLNMQADANLRGAAASKAAADATTQLKDGMLALQQGRLAGEAAGRASQSAINTENLQAQAERVEEFQETVIAAGEEIDQAATQRNERLDSLEEAHAETVTGLTDDITEAQREGEQSRTDAVEKGAADRLEIEQSNADAINDLIDSHTQSESRLGEDQRISDDRSLREYNQGIEQATLDHNVAQEDALDDLNAAQELAQDDHNAAQLEAQDELQTAQEDSLKEHVQNQLEAVEELQDAQLQAQKDHGAAQRDALKEFERDADEARTEFYEGQQEARDNLAKSEIEQAAEYDEQRLETIAEFQQNEQEQLDEHNRALADMDADYHKSRNESIEDFELERAGLLAQGKIAEATVLAARFERERRRADEEFGQERGQKVDEFGRSVTDRRTAHEEQLAQQQEQFTESRDKARAALKDRHDDEAADFRERQTKDAARFEERQTKEDDALALRLQRERDNLAARQHDEDTDFTARQAKERDALALRQTEEDTALATRLQRERQNLIDRQKEEDDAFTALQKQAQLDRDEMLADQDADRKLQKERRDTDYGVQLQELKESNANRLTEFDDAQKLRISQIEGQTQAQVDAIKLQLGEVDKKYVAARDKVNEDYDTFITDLNQKLKDSANELDMLPDEARQRELANAYGILGDTLGAALVAGLKGQVAGGFGTIVPGAGGTKVPGGTVGNGTTADDPRISAGALRTLFPGATLGDTFDASRPGTTGTHQGLDIQLTNGTPFRLPVDLLITKISRDQFGPGGWTVQGTDDQGRTWLFAHFQGLVRGLQAGEKYAKGSVIGYIGSRHTHVQLRDAGGTVVDPTAALEAAAGVAQATPAASSGVAAQSYGGASTYGTGSAYGAARMDLPRIPLPGVSAAPVALAPQTITVNVPASVVMDGRVVGELVAPTIHQQITNGIDLAINIGQTTTPIGVSQSTFRSPA